MSSNYAASHPLLNPSSTCARHFKRVAFAALSVALTSPVFAEHVDIDVAWDAVGDDRVASYEVYWGTTSGDYQWSTDSISTEATLTGLTAGQRYYIAARACADGKALCSDYSEEIIAIPEFSAPQADFQVTAAAGVAPHLVTFTNRSTGPVETHSWQFGDGHSSADVSPTHTYTQPGTYNVTLTVSGPGGTSSTTIESAVTIDHPAPIADFSQSQTSGVDSVTVTFSDQSTGAVDTFLWDFGDGNVSTAPMAVHTYTDVGTYTVNLTVQGPGGQSTKTKTDLIVVGPAAPSADFASDLMAGPAPLEINFSTTSRGAITSYHWDFGDGTSSVAADPKHTFTESGVYDVSLTVTGPGGSDQIIEYGYVQVDTPEIPLEAGEILLKHEWQRVDFERVFDNPVVIAKSLSTNGGHPATVRVESIDSEGFWVRVQEWDYLDGRHAWEAVGYLVIERGIHQLPDGSLIEADLVEVNEAFALASFTAEFEQPPVVISTVASVNDGGAVTTRMRNIDVEGFELRLQTEEAETAGHAPETAAYIAWEPSSGTINGLPFEVGRTADEVTHETHRIDFTAGFEQAPILIADMQSTDGGDPANLRWTNKGAEAVEIWVDEEQSFSAETAHTTETVGYILL